MSSSLTRGTIFCSSKNGLKKAWWKKKLSLEPDSNQRPKDLCKAYYSPPLYQLSYQGNVMVQERMCTRILENIGGKKKRGKSVAADGFDPSTSGLWAQHASTAPRCCGGREGKLPNVDEKKGGKKKACLFFGGEEKRKRPIRDLNP